VNGATSYGAGRGYEEESKVEHTNEEIGDDARDFHDDGCEEDCSDQEYDDEEFEEEFNSGDDGDLWDGNQREGESFGERILYISKSPWSPF
jgi:hypothetical protein